MTLVTKIQELSESNSTTLIGLEREINLGRGTIRKWDTNSPSVDKVEKVADYFNVSLDYLLDRDTDTNNISPEVLTLAQEITNLSKEKVNAIKQLIKSFS